MKVVTKLQKIKENKMNKVVCTVSYDFFDFIYLLYLLSRNADEKRLINYYMNRSYLIAYNIIVAEIGQYNMPLAITNVGTRYTRSHVPVLLMCHYKKKMM